MKNLFILILVVAISACNSGKNKKGNNHSITDQMSKDNIKSKTTVILKVNAEEVECYGAHGKQNCLQIKELGVDEKWQNQYEGIEGFTFVPGFVYNLQVEKIELNEVPQDASSIVYKLIQVIKKEKPITDAMMSDYETLIVTKIENGRDGYMATLKNDKGSVFETTISIPNLEDNYVLLNVGDEVKIAGEYNNGRILAKKIKLIKEIVLDKLLILTVTKIENGKDGYTAILKNEAGSIYTCTISIPNLEDNYKELEVGDKVKIAGEYAESDPIQIFAKKIKVIERAALKNVPELTVTKVIGEKDGETIHLTDSKNKAYNMIVSVPNLGKDYVRLKVGDKVKVEGEYIDSFPTQIFAKKIHKL